jgi:iron complex outermembrane receptor protein
MILSHSSSFENNTNFGSRVIIPDALMFETSVSAFYKFYLHKVTLETGIGVNDKFINTLLTVGVNTPDRTIHPFAKNWITTNGLLGITYNPTQHWNLKLNAASGFRAPNLAELSSNGLHEGIFHYELGDPNLKTEQNISTDISVSYLHSWFNLNATAYFNKFFNYIYLQPVPKDFYGFPWYDYMQQDAFIAGGETELEFTPQEEAKGFSASLNFSDIVGKTKDGNYLPYVPAAKTGGTFKYMHNVKEMLNDVFGSVSFEYVFEQNHPAPLETNTAGYVLLNASVGGKIVFKKTTLSISLTANNLLNEKYYDHLSRFKNYGIYNIGRNFILNVGVPFSFQYPDRKKHS